MRIAFLSPRSFPGFGSEKATEDLARRLMTLGHQVFFIYSTPSSAPPDCHGSYVIEGMGGLHYLNRLVRPSRAARIRGELFSALAEVRPDVVHLVDTLEASLSDEICSRFPTLLTAHTLAPTCPASGRFVPAGGGACDSPSGWGCLALHKRQGCLGGFRNDAHRLHVLVEYQRRRASLQKFARIVAVSDYVRRTLVLDGVPPERIALVYNPVSVKVAAPAKKEAGRSMVCSSRLVPQKGLSLLLSALGQLPFAEWSLSICGSGPLLPELERQKEELGLSSRVRFLGALPYEQAQELVAGAKVFVQTSIGPESFGLAAAEASALGVAVVGFRIPALDEVVRHGETGLLVWPMTPEALAAALRNLWGEPGLAERLGDGGRAWVKQRFSLEAHVEAMLAVYEEITGIGSDGKRERPNASSG